MVTLKIKFNDDNRRFKLDKDTLSFEELQSNYLNKFIENLPSEYVVKYTDEEGDLITIGSDLEFNEALALARSSNPDILRITIVSDYNPSAFAINNKDVSELACNAMTNFVQTSGFQSVVNSPGFQQLLPQIIRSEAFQKNLLPQLLDKNTLQQVIPAVTSVSQDLNNLFTAIVPIILNSNAMQQQVQESQKKSEVSPPNKPTTEKETTRSFELEKHVSQFEVVDISEQVVEEQNTPSASTQTTSASPASHNNVSPPASPPVSIPIHLSTPVTPTPTITEAAPVIAIQAQTATTSPPDIPVELQLFVKQLVDMGFTDIQENLRLLEENSGDLQRVVYIYLTKE